MKGWEALQPLFEDFFIDLFLYKLVCSTLAFHKYLRYVGPLFESSLYLWIRILLRCTIVCWSPYALGLCDIFYVHCSLVLFTPEAHGICEFCLTNSASQVSRVSLSRIPYGSTCSLWSHGSISHSMLVKSLA